jgi:Zn ribbon nucleic-acid-binding protein
MARKPRVAGAECPRCTGHELRAWPSFSIRLSYGVAALHHSHSPTARAARGDPTSLLSKGTREFKRVFDADQGVTPPLTPNVLTAKTPVKSKESSCGVETTPPLTVAVIVPPSRTLTWMFGSMAVS